jgi:mRNA-degrading endonuclease YafQ of YafQ-DinJ toxin-antitoxin module
MLNIVLSNHFKKDLKMISRCGYSLDLLNDVVDKLARDLKRSYL